jgi:hypothetical protein
MLALYTFMHKFRFDWIKVVVIAGPDRRFLYLKQQSKMGFSATITAWKMSDDISKSLKRWSWCCHVVGVAETACGEPTRVRL